ncbi:hypothetical protein PPACK8108_LOCUS20929 [Phakopsora pachyrhizi]|uniref:CBF1-interacting co-repressor CIR N-terminal domain-containing protein n=1 Tax=Phakopsora pachyrhizi TaxID=170000 RepID=A0AAV0BJK8_PHAPC|nr:hypothetical protein PPACK8108_LOCUS20929 [Phakopsora pachyrhizi]
MGKLNILYHKSYHVYNRDNVARVKRDELQAQIEQDQKDQATIAANSEARLNLLRQSKDRSQKQSSAQRQRQLEKSLNDQLSGKTRLKLSPQDDGEDDYNRNCQTASSSSLSQSQSRISHTSIFDPNNGHINLWSDLENQTTSKVFTPSTSSTNRSRSGGLQQNQSYVKDLKAQDQKFEDLITMRLDRPANELKPWYSQPDLISGESKKICQEKSEQLKSKDKNLKEIHDPLTTIKKTLYPNSIRALRPQKRRERQASRSPSPTEGPKKTIDDDGDDDDEGDMPTLPPSLSIKPRGSDLPRTDPEVLPKVLKVDVSVERDRARQLIEMNRRKNDLGSSDDRNGMSVRGLGYSDESRKRRYHDLNVDDMF